MERIVDKLGRWFEQTSGKIERGIENGVERVMFEMGYVDDATLANDPIVTSLLIGGVIYILVSFYINRKKAGKWRCGFAPLQQ